jgi:hypothetical protein
VRARRAGCSKSKRVRGEAEIPRDSVNATKPPQHDLLLFRV